MAHVKFMQGVYNKETLIKILEQGGEKVQGLYILPDGTMVYLKGEDGIIQEIEARNLDIDLKNSEEGFEKIDSKTPTIYDLEARIREINCSSAIVEIPLEKIQRLVWEVGAKKAEGMLNQMYPQGFKTVIYSDKGMEIFNRIDQRDKRRKFIDAVRECEERAANKKERIP